MSCFLSRGCISNQEIGRRIPVVIFVSSRVDSVLLLYYYYYYSQESNFAVSSGVVRGFFRYF